MFRDSITKLQKYLETERSEVVLIEGARQVGKTYMALEAISSYENKILLNLETDKVLKEKIDECKNFEEFTELLFLKKGFNDSINQIVFVDEVQESEKIGSFVRDMKETWKFTKTILTGSSTNKLFQGDTRVPVGRIKYISQRPFSFREFLRFLNKEELLNLAAENPYKISKHLHDELLNHFDNYLMVGGMPEAVKSFSEKADYTEIFSFIMASQKDDFLRKEKVKSHLFMDALKGVANHAGGPSKNSHVGTSSYEAKKIIELLKEWKLIIEVEQKGSLSTQNFHSKRYLYDIGILRFIRDNAIPKISTIHTTDEALRIPLGGIIENVVLLELLGSRGGYNEITSWKKNNKENIEVDFIYKNQDCIIPVEVKSSLTLSQRHFSNLVYYLTKYKQCQRGFIISLAMPSKTIISGKEIVNLPAYLAEFINTIIIGCRT